MTPAFIRYAVLFFAASIVHAQAVQPLQLAAGDVTASSPRLSWTLASSTNSRGIRQTDYEIQVASTKALLSSGHPDLWDSGRVASSSMNAIYRGKALPAGSTIIWQVKTWQTAIGHRTSEPSSWSAPATFITPLSAWSAQWIAATPDAAAGAPLGVANDHRLPVFRRALNLRGKPTSAMLFVSGLGQFEFHINGRNVTQDIITPGWTDYRKHILYDSYDVTPLLTVGDNALAVLLGNGMYNALEVDGRYSKFSNSYGQPKVIAELHLTYADGAAQTVATDETWRTAPGPITFSNVYGGEDDDARLEPAAWDQPGFDDSAWATALRVASPGGQIVLEQTPPVRVLDRFKPIAVTHPRAGLTVYDLGQNFAGMPEINVTGPAGAVVTMLPGELLDAAGLVTQNSAHASPSDPAEFRYTLRGTGNEVWHPRFSYYGFRYVQIEASSPQVQVIALTGLSIHSDARQTGTFTSSDDLMNRIHRLILNAVRSNMMSILTDCPHREKLGWLEQTHLFAGSLMANYDVSALYAKMAADMDDAQLQSGLVPSIAPEVTQFNNSAGRPSDFRDSPEWGSAMILSPWAAYQIYGDPAPLRAHYAAMQRYVAFLQAKADDHLLNYGLGDWYDIGPKAPGYSQLTSKMITATGTLYEDLTAMQGIAQALGNPQDAQEYQQQAAAVRAAFNAALFHPEAGNYDRGSQTANAMPLALGMVPEQYRDAVLQNLVRDIEAHQFHVTAGDVGFHYVVRALTDGHRSDVLAKMLAVKTSPSYGYQLSRGATTLTEAWDTNPNSSQNHFMLGHAEEWFYRGLAGIDFNLSRPRNRQIVIHPWVPAPFNQPAPADPLTHASASIETVLGEVSSQWSLKGDHFEMQLSIPSNSTAVLVLPQGFHHWQESGRPLASAPGISMETNSEELRLGSGHYTFEALR